MKKALYVFLAGTLPLLVSCYNSRFAYSPSAHNVPVLKKAGDSKIAGYYSMNNPATTGYANGVTTYSRGFDGQAAVAITDHFAVMANYYRRWEKNGGDEDYYNNDISEVYYSRELVEGALGYFTALDDGKKVYLQIFTGGAIGKFKIDDYSINHVLKNYHYSDVSKLFMQPAIQFAISKNFAASASTKFTYVYYSDINTSYTDDELSYYYLKNLNLGSRIFLNPPSPVISDSANYQDYILKDSSDVLYSGVNKTLNIGSPIFQWVWWLILVNYYTVSLPNKSSATCFYNLSEKRTFSLTLLYF